MDAAATNDTRPREEMDARLRELVQFVQDVALGKRKATPREISRACELRDRYLPD